MNQDCLGLDRLSCDWIRCLESLNWRNSQQNCENPNPRLEKFRVGFPDRLGFPQWLDWPGVHCRPVAVGFDPCRTESVDHLKYWNLRVPDPLAPVGRWHP